MLESAVNVLLPKTKPPLSIDKNTLFAENGSINLEYPFSVIDKWLQ